MAQALKHGLMALSIKANTIKTCDKALEKWHSRMAHSMMESSAEIKYVDLGPTSGQMASFTKASGKTT